MVLRVRDIVFLKSVIDPHSDGRSINVDRLQYVPGKEFAVVEEGGWLKITGKKRSFWSSKTNIAFMVVDEEPEPKAVKK